MVWYTVLEVDPPAVDPTLRGRRRDELNNVNVSINLPDSITDTPN